MIRFILSLLVSVGSSAVADRAFASKSEPIVTNEALFHNSPAWLKRNRAEKVIRKIQRELEWSTRRINVYFYTSEEAFKNAQSLGSLPRAVTVKSKSEQVIHLSPRVNDKNFDQVLGHEMVHIIFFQKYSGAIPQWLEEGFANHLAGYKSVDYKWLKSQPFPNDIASLTHPFKQSQVSIKYHYMASQALVHMLDTKCDLENLLRLSVQRKMEDYINTFCEIPNINLAFRDWVNKKSGHSDSKKKKYWWNKKDEGKASSS